MCGPTLDETAHRTGTAEWVTTAFGRDEPESVLSIIQLDGEPVGRFRVVRYPDRIFLAGIQILPAFQGRGIGTHLITKLHEEARAKGLPLQLEVAKDNPSAERLYRRLGFVQYGENAKDLQMAPG